MRNGLTPPKTWDEMLALCATLKSKNITPIIATGQVDYYVGMWSDYLFQRFVGAPKMMEYLYGTTGTKLAGNADALKALQEMQKLPPYLIDGWQGVDFTTSQVYFFQEKAAMILMGSWLMAEMKETIPPDFQLAVAGFPSVAGGNGKQDSVFGSAFGWSVAAKSKVPDLAIEYLRRFSSDEWAGKRATELGVLSCNKAVPAPAAIIGAKQVMADAANADLIVYHWGTINAKFGLQSGLVRSHLEAVGRQAYAGTGPGCTRYEHRGCCATSAPPLSRTRHSPPDPSPAMRERGPAVQGLA